MRFELHVRWMPLVLLAVFSSHSAGAEPDEIVVSVRKTDENIQQVPIQVNSLNEQLIQSEAVRSLQDVAELTPSLVFDTGFWPSDTRVSIRGLFNRAGRPSAAVLIDGIDAISESIESSGGSALLNQRLLDVERIEVARGPQSALYGRTAFAGAINYVTRRPSDQLEATLESQIASGGRFEVRSTLGGPLVDGVLSAKVIGSHYELEGDYSNPNTGGRLGGGESNGFGFSFNWTPTDEFSAYWNNTYSNDSFAPNAIAAVQANQFRILKGDGSGVIINQIPDPLNDVASAGCTEPPPFLGNDSCLWAFNGTLDAGPADIDLVPDPRSAPGNPQDYPGTRDRTLRSNLILDWDISDAWAFRSATSYTDANQRIAIDTTRIFSVPGSAEQYGTPAGFYSDAQNAFEFQQLYQELQLSRDAGGAVNWLAGLNAFVEKASDLNTSRFWYRDPSLYLCQPGGFPPFTSFAANCSSFADAPVFDKTIARDTDSYSVFGLFGWQVTQQWKLTLEGRLIRDKVEVSANTADLAADSLNFVLFDPDPANSFTYARSPGFTDDISDNNFLPRATLEFVPSDDLLFYASLSKGIKPPTFNTNDLNDPAIARVKKEKLWAYEVGGKSTLHDGKLLLNGAVFYNDYKDQQVRIQFPPPAGSTTPQSGTANAGKVTVWGFEVDASWLPTERLTLNASYAYTNGEFDDLVLADAQPPAAPVSRNERAKSLTEDADYSGNDTPGNPEHAATFLARYDAPLTSKLDWYAQGVASYQGERYADIANLAKLESYWLANAQLGLQQENWFFSVFVDNIFDDDTIRFAQEFIDQSQGFQSPDPVAPGAETLTFPVAYFAYLPQPRTIGVRFSVRTP